VVTVPELSLWRRLEVLVALIRKTMLPGRKRCASSGAERRRWLCCTWATAPAADRIAPYLLRRRKLFGVSNLHLLGYGCPRKQRDTSSQPRIEGDGCTIANHADLSRQSS